jgi:hypothetical protein
MTRLFMQGNLFYFNCDIFKKTFDQILEPLYRIISILDGGYGLEWEGHGSLAGIFFLMLLALITSKVGSISPEHLSSKNAMRSYLFELCDATVKSFS